MPRMDGAWHGTIDFRAYILAFRRNLVHYIIISSTPCLCCGVVYFRDEPLGLKHELISKESAD